MAPDINILELLQEPVEVSSTANSEEFFAPPMPDDGEHLAVLHLGDRGIKVERQKDAQGNRNGAAYLSVHLQGKILNDAGEEGISTFDNVTSIVMQSSGTSRLHAILDLSGSPAPARCSLGELKDLVEPWIAQSPRIGLTTQWEAQVNDGTQQKPNYRTVLRGQKKFPSILDADGNPTGKYNPEIQDPKTGVTVRAQARVVKYSRPQ